MADEPETYDPAFVPQKAGLNNTGVICHLNSLLQGLIGCSAVVRAAFAHPAFLARTTTGRAFYDFIYAAVPAARPPGAAPFGGETAVENCSALVLEALRVDLRARRPQFRYGPGQESASEGLVLLLDMLGSPGEASEANPIARLFYHRNEARVFCRGCRACVSEETDVAVQFNLFHFDALAEPPRTPEAFGRLLRSHVSFLEDYRCEACGEVAGGFRHYRLRMVPEVLVCLFNLYDDRRARVARYFPARVPFPGLGGGRLVYREVAQVEQSGTRRGGHYVARGLRADGKVYLFNDAHAAESAFGPAPNVYMVFYHCERLAAGGDGSGVPAAA